MKKYQNLVFLLLAAGLYIAAYGCFSGSGQKDATDPELDSPEIAGIAIRAAGWSAEHNLDGMGYHNMCAAYGVLKVSDITGTDSLRKEVAAALRPELLEGVNPHRDNAKNKPQHQWFGFVPLKLFLMTDKAAYLERGIEMAEEQYKDADSAGMPGYTGRMFVDDIYGATTMQALAYTCTGKPEYLERAVRQVLFYSKEFMQEEGLFYHNPDEAPYFWGRGNGWCAAAYAELFSVLPEDHPGREEVLTYYHRMMEALLTYQGSDGMWHQIIDDPDSWNETSCTGMFLFSMLVGLRTGLLSDDTYLEPAIRAWDALSGYLDGQWRLTEICAGTGFGDRDHYRNRPRLVGDAHGQAAFLWAASAMLEIAGGNKESSMP